MPPCANCGRQLSPRATTCPGCGEPGPAGRTAVATTLAAVGRTDSFAIASLVCSASAFFGTFLVGSVLGIILGKMSRTRLAADPDLEGDGLARTGVILGWVGVGLAVLMLLLGMAMFSSVTRSTGGPIHIGF